MLQAVEDDDGKIYAVPTAAYAMGLHYNRAMFEAAGLDPDEPPTSWDEVREYAKAISDATGQAGYIQMTQDSTGGWALTSVVNAMGGRVEDGSGDDVTATLDDPAVKEALETLQAMRWEDDSMGDNFLFDWGGVNQAFAAGQAGMYISGSDVYNSLVTENSVDPASYGLTTVPLDGDDAGVLGGGDDRRRAPRLVGRRAGGGGEVDRLLLPVEAHRRGRRRGRRRGARGQRRPAGHADPAAVQRRAARRVGQRGWPTTSTCRSTR